MQRRVVFSTQGRELFQLLALFAVQPAWHFHQQPGKKIAPLAAVNLDHALAAQSKALTTLCARRHFQAGFSFEGRDRHFAAERRSREGNRHFAKQVVLLALKDRVFLDVEDDVEIALVAPANACFTVMRRTET